MASPEPRRWPFDRIWLNEERTILVTLWHSDPKMKASHQVTVALRKTPADTWSQPIFLDEEKE